jgi:hypothetical protein
MNAYQLFIVLLTTQLFYALSVTLLVPFFPNATSNQVVMYTNSNNVINFNTLSESMGQGISNQSSLPILDTGALIFYSSGVILSLMVNFFTAIPQMITALLSGFFFFIPINYTLAFTIKSLAFVFTTILYYLVLFSYITQTRTGGGILG